MADNEGFRNDWATKDFYQVLGVAKDASAADIKKAYRKLARANHPDSNPGDDAKHEKFKAVAEAYDVVGDEAKRAKYDEFRSLQARGGFGARHGRGWRRLRRRRRRVQPRRPAPRPRRCGRWARRHVRRPLRRRPARAHPAAGPAPPGRRRREHGDDRLHRRARRRDGVAAADLRHGLPDLPGHRRQARHPPAHLPGVRGRGIRRVRHGRGVLDQRDLPRLRRAPAGVRRGVPDLPRQRSRHLGAHHPGPHPGRGQGRREDPAQGQGRQPATTAARPATCSSRSRSRPTASSAARATTSPSTSPSPSTRRRSAAR